VSTPTSGRKVSTWASVERELEHQWGDSGTETVIAFDIFWPRIETVMKTLPLKRVVLTGVQQYMPFVKRALVPLELRRRGKWVNVQYDDERLFR
jgi:long-chain acyl-CoA synthetase